MVRETRHLWVGNLPENVGDEQLLKYFSRFGGVESVRVLPKRSADGGRASFVDFIDIKSAVKAHEATHKMGSRELRTNYNEPGAKFSFGRHARGASISRRRYERREGYYRLLS
jgi:RNA recognition motif-containing protein